MTSADPDALGAQVGDHWHATIRMEICGEEISLPPSSGGVHSHGDDRIHIHPQDAGEAGPNASLGRFFDSFPMIMETGRIQVPGGESYQNGSPCPDGEAGTVQVLVSGEDFTNTLRSYTPKEGNQVEVYFR